MTPPSQTKSERRGVTTVEFALTAPVLFLFCFAGIEFSRVTMMVHTASIAATEGARRGIVAGATAADCYEAAQAELVAVGIQKASIDIKPSSIDETTQMITVGVRIPLILANGYVTPEFFLGDEVVRTVSITREAKDTQGSATQAEQLNTQSGQDLVAGGGEAAGILKDKGIEENTKDKQKKKKKEKKKKGKKK